jgi:hypothetical protein
MTKATAAEAEELETKPRIAALADAVHVVTTSKGGVCKTFDAVCLTEYFVQTGRLPISFDADYANQTFSKFKGLDVKVVNAFHDNTVNPRAFDEMLETIVSNKGPFVVDTGSDSFHAIWDYMVAQDLFALLQSHWRPVVIHTPIAPEADLENTLAAFDAMCFYAPDRSVIPWLNERDAPILVEDKIFSDFEVAKRNVAKLLGIIRVKNRREGFHRTAVRDMLKNKLTFAEAMQRGYLIDRTRIGQVRQEVFEQIEGIGL